MFYTDQTNKISYIGQTSKAVEIITNNNMRNFIFTRIITGLVKIDTCAVL